MTATTDAGTSAGLRPNHYENVTCPFCGILCDDLEITPDEKGLRVSKNACSLARAGFERPVGERRTPTAGGKPVSREEAIAAAARLIGQAKLPLYGGLATDVEGMRAVMSIADRSRGVVDHALSEGQYRNFRVLQTSGWFMSTLTEARNRADLIVVVGCDLHKIHPRFFERVVATPDSMFAEPAPKRTVVFLGNGLDQSAATGPRIGEVITVPCPPTEVGEVVSAIRAAVNGRPVGERVAGVPAAQIRSLAELFKSATYGVMVWAPPGLAFENADLTVHAVSELVKDLNHTTRFAGLSLGGNEGAVTAGAVCGWQAGYPLRVSFASGKPDYDQYRYAIGRMLAAGEGDMLVWIASISPTIVPPATSIPTVVLGTPDLKLTTQPAVFIPVGTPGIDHDGRLVRCDNVVSLPLRSLNRTDLPSVARVVGAIEALL